VVRDRERGRFDSWDAIRKNGALTIVVPPVPYFVDKLQERLPRARLVTVETTDAAFAALASDADAVALPAERGSAWTLRYPQYAVVVPAPDLVKVPLAYAMPRGASELAAFVDTWIDLKHDDGTIEALYQYWILGRAAAPRGPRWSIIRDVLHWVE
jgi:ABC-type amino acid transport substrate-binding protein